MLLLSDLTASAAAHTVTYLQFASMPFAPEPKPPTIDFGGGNVAPPIKNFGENLLQNVLFAAAIIAFIGAIILALMKVLGGNKTGGKAVLALVIAVVCLTPAVFFGTVQNIWNSLSSS